MPPLLVRCHDEATQARRSAPGYLEAVEDGATRCGTRGRSWSAPVIVPEIELGAYQIPYVKFGGLQFTDTAHVKDF